jgi:hypothetical protein
MADGTELAVSGAGGLMRHAVKMQDVMAVHGHIQEIMKGTMTESVIGADGKWDGEGDYGIIPGTHKRTLFQPGAEKLLIAFGMTAIPRPPKFEDLGNGHREVIVETEIRSMNTDQLHAVGVGSCSTMEPKYRYRNVSDFEILDEPIPADAKERKKEYRSRGFGMKKVDSGWAWVRYKDAVQSENPDIAETYNTVLAMANKRSMVSGVKRATASSSMFTTDLEDAQHEEAPPAGKPPVKPTTQRAPAAPPAKSESVPPVTAAAVASKKPTAEVLEKCELFVSEIEEVKIRAALHGIKVKGKWLNTFDKTWAKWAQENTGMMVNAYWMVDSYTDKKTGEAKTNDKLMYIEPAAEESAM